MAVVLRMLGSIAAGVLVVGLATGCGSDGDADQVATDDSSTPSTEASSPTADPTPTDQPTDQPSETPSDSAAPASWPACADVWVGGADLPSPYRGCALDGTAVRAESTHCSMGAVLVTYDDHFWGVAGHPISQAQGVLKKDPEFRRVLATCTA